MKSRGWAAWNGRCERAEWRPMLPATLQFLIVMIASAINDQLQRAWQRREPRVLALPWPKERQPSEGGHRISARSPALSPGQYGTGILPSNRCCSSASLPCLRRQANLTLGGLCVPVAPVSRPVEFRRAPSAAHLGTAWPRGRVALQSWPGPAPMAPHRRPSLGTWPSARSACGG